MRGGCVKCGKEIADTTHNIYFEEFRRRSVKKFDTKFNYFEAEYNGYRNKTIVSCNIHGHINITPIKHLKSLCGCPICGEKIRIQPRVTFDEFVTRSRLIHGDQYLYNESKFSCAKKKTAIECKKHGSFDMTPSSHLQGYGCTPCGYEKVSKMNTVTQYNFIKKAFSVHGNTYDYSKTIYTKAHAKITITCKAHGEFNQDAYAHLNGCGCHKCGIKRRPQNSLIPQDDIIKRFNAVHGGKYDYSLVEYTGIENKISIICQKHGVFKQEPGSHLAGRGCSKCSHVISKPEMELADFVSSLCNIDQNSKSIIPPYELDIFILSKNIAIEFNGLLWHSEKLKKDRMRHQRKHLLCAEKGIRLIQVWEDDWKFKRELIKSMIKIALGITDKTIFARKTNIKSIDGHTARLFLEEYHLNGFRAASIHKGLFYKDELVMVASFSKPSVFMKNQTSDMEILRMATKQGIRVTGGLSKVIASIEFNELSTFADALWFDGGGYKSAGFEANGLTQPGYEYVMPSKYIRKHRFNFTKKKISQKFDNYDESISEQENMNNNGYYRLYDAGHYRFLIKKPRQQPNDDEV